MQEINEKIARGSSTVRTRLVAVLISVLMIGISIIAAVTHVAAYWWVAAVLVVVLLIVDVGCAIRAKKLTLLDAAGVVCALTVLVMSVVLAMTPRGN